ncbi:His-Xaa-Ser system radical SAM maturase HxsC [Ralstonia solanacearum]|uniref:His-Xaa-Ser system radical SAM maturase HxsC n=1 Tax=Ralstonia solanacearum TaxID=305 RepID=UPI00078C8BCF|nr:His-Xaa-Ser system radical SAM maturase HxsC [Ralstonia solanacearum]AMP38850.1 His-Xaa-Ser system radical SAM maturase HxsC [Ralstonia solanacearum]AXV87678.1 His-Xaa-Ser system radical SAM maturase HxsC [Ralstonia solanacearum]AXW07141.1 His-Xaa-Ser system radical SAM maturase HxsC [Ralstonia solanacearum]AXW24923.1 His-Xaa-Ser system radical SAM maturase HxsC [Ralstonia solanacearum]AXW81836.1 His-Xaa-Ser system radical SAM maturase HxsC [Ralstonia solanacearum]
MLTLGGRVIHIQSQPTTRQLLSLSTDANLPAPLRQNKAFLAKAGSPLPQGFKHYLVFEQATGGLATNAPCTLLGDSFRYLDNEDVLALSTDGRVRVLFRANSRHNSLLLTEQCNNYCLMCSQPPKRVDDSWLLHEAMEAVRLIPRHTASLGITGGEPTLFGDGFIGLLRHMKNWLPHTAVHVLSNGRTFADMEFARSYASTEHPDLMVGIPVYSADPACHDYVVQAKGAFDETIRGILNLKRLNQKVEIRVVLHKQTVEGLPLLAEYIARNLLFVDHVALMGLEITGFTRANLDSLWIDPIEYRDQLSRAVRILSTYGINTSVYNHPLCLVNQDVAPHYVKSISDWKNEYASECAPCVRKDECGGFFSSGIEHKYSASLKPFAA